MKKVFQAKIYIVALFKDICIFETKYVMKKY